MVKSKAVRKNKKDRARKKDESTCTICGAHVPTKRGRCSEHRDTSGSSDTGSLAPDGTSSGSSSGGISGFIAGIFG
jgi:hypothetical protein